MLKIQEMLDEVELSTGKKFLCANFMEAKKEYQWFYNQSRDKANIKLFSNRLVETNICHKIGNNMTDDNQFIRIDFEKLDCHHEYFTTQEDVDTMIAFGKKANALSVMKTTHGIHTCFLTSDTFKWKDVRNIVRNLTKGYKGNLQVDYKATVHSSNWSKVHTGELAYFNKSARIISKEYNDYTIVSQLNNNNTSDSNNNERLTKEEKKAFVPTFSDKKQKGGSESHKRAEFGFVIGKWSEGVPFKDIPTQFHNREKLEAVLKSGKYANFFNAKGKTQEFALLGINSRTRGIQRNFTFWGHLQHSITDLAASNYSMDAIYMKFCEPQFNEIREQLLCRVGEEKWMDKLKENIEFLRENFGVWTGNYQVSPALIKQIFGMLRTKRNITANAIRDYLIPLNPKRNEYHTAPGTSLRHAYRILHVLQSNGLVDKNHQRICKGNKKLLLQCIEFSKKPDLNAEITEYEEITTTESKQKESSTTESVQCVEIQTLNKVSNLSSLQQKFRSRHTPYQPKVWAGIERCNEIPLDMQKVSLLDTR